MEPAQIIEGAKIPNFFYDLIVFMTPSLSLTIGIMIGLGDCGFKFISDHLRLIKVEGFSLFILFMFLFFIFLFMAYEYGRLAEALSIWIGDLVKFFRKRKLFFKRQKDYNTDFTNEISKLNLKPGLDNDRIGKWTIYFYAMRFQPAIGNDILKRYAWEKLSRSSAFTFGILFCISFIFAITRVFKIKALFGYSFDGMGNFGFGSLAYCLLSFLLFVMTCYEYYRRKSWNNDLLIKILPILIIPENTASTSTADIRNILPDSK